MLGARQTTKLKSLEDEIRGKGGRAVAVQMDVTDTASIAKAIDSAEATLGHVSVLINNAGIALEKLAVDQTETDWYSVINANLKGAYFAATEIARRMIARKQEGNTASGFRHSTSAFKAMTGEARPPKCSGRWWIG